MNFPKPQLVFRKVTDVNDGLEVHRSRIQSLPDFTSENAKFATDKFSALLGRLFRKILKPVIKISNEPQTVFRRPPADFLISCVRRGAIEKSNKSYFLARGP